MDSTIDTIYIHINSWYTGEQAQKIIDTICKTYPDATIYDGAHVTLSVNAFRDITKLIIVPWEADRLTLKENSYYVSFEDWVHITLARGLNIPMYLFKNKKYNQDAIVEVANIRHWEIDSSFKSYEDLKNKGVVKVVEFIPKEKYNEAIKGIYKGTSVNFMGASKERRELLLLK